MSKEKINLNISGMTCVNCSNGIEKFLNKDMSLALLASHLETNTKYLSEVINKYKGKNFNVYINELRINYIVSKLKTNPMYFPLN